MSAENDWENCESDATHEKPSWKCIHCSNVFCEVCMKKHKRKDRNRFHCIIRKSERQREEELRNLYFCKIHEDAELNLYCTDDNIAVCRFCLGEEHKGHHVEPIEEVAKPYRTDVGALLTELDKHVIPKYEKCAESVKMKRSMLEQDDKVQHNVKNIADEMVASIQKRAIEIEEEEKEEKLSKQTMAASLRERESKVDEEIERLVGVLAKVRKALENNGHNDLIQNAKQWKEMMAYDEKDLSLPTDEGKQRKGRSAEDIRRELVNAALNVG